MSIAIFAPTLHGGGAERNMLNLARAFAARGHEVDLVLANAEGPYLRDVPSNVRLVDLDASRVALSLYPLIKYLRARRPKAALSTLPHANSILIVANRLAGRPSRIVVREANTVSEVHRNGTNLKARMMRPIVKAVYPAADAIVAVSDGVRDDLITHVGLQDQNIHTVVNPTVTPDLSQHATAPIKGPAPIANGTPFVLGVGSLTRQKGFDVLMDAFARAATTLPDHHLVILGEGPERTNLLRQAEDHDLQHRIHLPGFVENPFAYMSRTALFVLSSRWEGMPNVLIQAMAVGASVVATDCPSGPSEILMDGTLAPLVDVDDAHALAAAIMDSATHDPDTAPLRRRAQAFHVDDVATRYLEVLHHA